MLKLLGAAVETLLVWPTRRHGCSPIVGRLHSQHVVRWTDVQFRVNFTHLLQRIVHNENVYETSRGTWTQVCEL